MTGFEPFGGHPENVSWEVARRVSCYSADGLELAVELLPVSFTRVAHSLRKAVERYTPDVVIMLGQSTLTDRVKLERVALNLMDSAMGDNDDYKPSEEPIYSGENNALFTTLPIKRLHTAIVDEGIPAKISNSAGVYVCNRLYYEALRMCRCGTMQALFIHLPLCEEQTTTNSEARRMPMADMVKAIEKIINEVTKDE
ncbi:MAG: pyroglutamyl-peptidase I [Alistipes sp.]|nr:pyroglutamyl-peptidase I [Alistipes sp.]